MQSEDVLFFKNIKADIEKIVLGYVSVRSFTASCAENEAGSYFENYFANIEYFKRHPEMFGSYSIEGDMLCRSVNWAMLKGTGNGTVVLIHHNDIVSVEDFKLLKDLAFSPVELEKGLHDIRETLSEEAKSDLDSGNYLFGRGTCDMKGGGAIQMALMERYSRIADRIPGNIIILGLPDEENMSAGMRSAVVLLKELKDKYSLNFMLMINSEPHQRKAPEEGVFSIGSVGKLMPFIYVRGFLAHAGKVFEGFNPLNVLCEIVRNTEMSWEFSDQVGTEASPPPTWLFLKDRKEHYDVSMPLSAYGYFSLLTLKQEPAEVLTKVREVSRMSFEKVLADINISYGSFCKATGRKTTSLPWKVNVTSFADLCKEAEANMGKTFNKRYAAKLHELSLDIQNSISYKECNCDLIDWLFENITDLAPRVVYGFIPPYYPHVSNISLHALNKDIACLPEELKNFVMETWGQEYDVESFYTGISDLSYSGISDSDRIQKTLCESMPFWGSVYKVPIKVIEQIAMPCINIGPWGKDFHKMTERVYKEDLYDRTVRIIKYAVDRTISTYGKGVGK